MQYKDKQKQTLILILFLLGFVALFELLIKLKEII